MSEADKPYQTTRDKAIEMLVVDAHMAILELADVLERGDVYRIRACLRATEQRAMSDMALGRWFFMNGVRGVWRYLLSSWRVGWRRGWQRGGRR